MVALTDEQQAALDDLRAVLPSHRVLLIGATALAQHVPLDYRTTEDLDLAIDIGPEAFPGPLATIPGWRPHPQMEHRFVTAKEQTVDVLPAGAAVRAAGKLVWPSGHEMNMEGFALAFEHAVPDGELLVPPAPALALLKMRSWLDRPAERRKDLDDLAHLMRGYADENDDDYWDPRVQDAYWDVEAIAPFLLGRDLARLAKGSHWPTIDAFLERATVERLTATGAWPCPANVTTARAAFEEGLADGAEQRDPGGADDGA